MQFASLFDITTIEWTIILLSIMLLLFDEVSLFLQDFIREVDPDIIIGYNICKFDLPYLIEVLI
jgi:DNA polymerase delta subunit 1